MKRAILITGFNNWGKTSHIYSVFDQSKFYLGKTYKIQGVNASFTVESHSNDDFGELRFINAVKKRIVQAPTKEKDILCAFCPTREKTNNSLRILQGKPFVSFDEIHILLLKYKWDFHAELRLNEIRKYLSSIPNVRFTNIDADENFKTDATRFQARDLQIISYLKKIYL